MSINFKNSLFKKLHTNSAFLDEQSQIDVSRKIPRRNNNYFDTSSSSSSSESEGKLLESRPVRDRSHNLARGRDSSLTREDYDRRQYHSILSRRDLSDSQFDSKEMTPLDTRAPRPQAFKEVMSGGNEVRRHHIFEDAVPKGADLRPEDLTSMIDQVYQSSQMQSSRISSTQSNDVLKTF